MDEKDIMIDPCYVLGTCLLYKNSVDRELLIKIEKSLSVYYEIDLSDANVLESVLEWSDFFRINHEQKIILTKEAICNKNLVRYIFADALESEIYERLVAIIFDIKEKKIDKTKILKFPQ